MTADTTTTKMQSITTQDVIRNIDRGVKWLALKKQLGFATADDLQMLKAKRARLNELRKEVTK